MEKLSSLDTVILSNDEGTIKTLNNLLSKYYLLNVMKVCKHEAEAIEHLNNHKTSLFFLDMDLSHILFDIQKPPFIVGLCDKEYTKKVKKLMKMGFFDFFYAPYTERELNSIMGKILNIYSSYNRIDPHVMQKVEEESILYNEEDAAANSVFIRGKRNEDGMRMYFNKILYFEKKGPLICVVFDDGFKKYYRSNLKMFHAKFPKSKFKKINRAVVVNMDKVNGTTSKNRIVISENATFEITRSFKKSIEEYLSNNE